MDFKNPEMKEQLSGKASDMLDDYREYLAQLIDDPQSYKKAALLYYWLRDYKSYLKNEAAFDSQCLPNFERGNIVNVNLGFNIGAEMGGLHYAVVLANSNRRNPNLVILPLTSVKPSRDVNHLRPTEVYLGEELYYMILGKNTALRASIPAELSLVKRDLDDGADIEQVDRKIDTLTHKFELLKKTMKKLHVLKHGSIAVLNQIRTVSKMRVVDPTDAYDILYGLKVSSRYLTAIDDALQKLYMGNRI